MKKTISNTANPTLNQLVEDNIITPINESAASNLLSSKKVLSKLESEFEGLNPILLHQILTTEFSPENDFIHLPEDQSKSGSNPPLTDKIKYRDYIGSLDSAMDEVLEFDSFDQLREYLSNDWIKFHKALAEMRMEHFGFDSRVGWNVYLVYVRFVGEDKFISVGFTNGNFPS